MRGSVRRNGSLPLTFACGGLPAALAPINPQRYLRKSSGTVILRVLGGAYKYPRVNQPLRQPPERTREIEHEAHEVILSGYAGQ